MSTDASDRLKLNYLMPAQAQKHVTVNEAFRALDAIIHLRVLDRDLASQPSSPSNGDAYILPSGPTGDSWDTYSQNDIAVYSDNAWSPYPPSEGWRAFVRDEAITLLFDGAGWVDEAGLIDSVNNLSVLGLGTTADQSNPFSAKLNTALWTARYDGEGGTGDLRCTLNKETSEDTVSLLFQSGFSGRAEIGLIGDEDLVFKVSPDGSIWKESIRITSAGRVGFGTNSPDGIFHFASNGNAGNTFLFEETDGGVDEKNGISRPRLEHLLSERSMMG